MDYTTAPVRARRLATLRAHVLQSRTHICICFANGSRSLSPRTALARAMQLGCWCEFGERHDSLRRAHPHSWGDFPNGMPPLPESDEEIAHLGDDTPIADIGTANHPVSTPPTAADVENAPAPPSRRYLWTGALAGLLGALFAVSLAPFFIDTITRRAELPEVRIQGHAAQPETAAARPAPHEVALDPVRIGTEPGRPRAAAGATQTKAIGRMPSLDSANFAAFDVTAANAAIDAAAAHASTCGGAAVGLVGVSVTFAPSGKATDAVIETELAPQGRSSGAASRERCAWQRSPRLAALPRPSEGPSL